MGKHYFSKFMASNLILSFSPSFTVTYDLLIIKVKHTEYNFDAFVSAQIFLHGSMIKKLAKLSHLCHLYRMLGHPIKNQNVSQLVNNTANILQQ